MKRSTLTLIGLLAIIILSSCSKKWDTPSQIADTNQAQDQNSEVSVMDDVVAPANFNWKTAKDVEVTITGSTDGLVEVSSARGIVYQKAYLTKDQSYTMKLTVPTYETSIKLKMDDRSEVVSITSGNVSYSFN